MFRLTDHERLKLILKARDQIDSLQRALDVLEHDASSHDCQNYLEKQVGRSREAAEEMLELLVQLEEVPEWEKRITAQSATRQTKGGQA